MTETPDKRQIYYIPENYISESRIHLGQSSLRVRYLVDSAGLSLVLGLFAVLIISLTMKSAGVQAKITVGLIICGPGFLIGQIGLTEIRFQQHFETIAYGERQARSVFIIPLRVCSGQTR